MTKFLLLPLILLLTFSSINAQNQYFEKEESSLMGERQRVAGTNLYLSIGDSVNLVTDLNELESKEQPVIFIVENDISFNELKDDLFSQPLEDDQELFQFSINDREGYIIKGDWTDDESTFLTIFYGDNNFVILGTALFEKDNKEEEERIKEVIKSFLYKKDIIDPGKENFKYGFNISPLEYLFVYASPNTIKYSKNGREDEKLELSNFLYLVENEKVDIYEAALLHNELKSEYLRFINSDWITNHDSISIANKNCLHSKFEQVDSNWKANITTRNVLDKSVTLINLTNEGIKESELIEIIESVVKLK